MQCIESNSKSTTALRKAATVPCLRRSSQDAPLQRLLLSVIHHFLLALPPNSEWKSSCR